MIIDKQHYIGVYKKVDIFLIVMYIGIHSSKHTCVYLSTGTWVCMYTWHTYMCLRVSERMCMCICRCSLELPTLAFKNLMVTIKAVYSIHRLRSCCLFRLRFQHRTWLTGYGQNSFVTINTYVQKYTRRFVGKLSVKFNWLNLEKGINTIIFLSFVFSLVVMTEQKH